ncbi:hypothetical protein Afe04nite_33720 [Asanoa ferruginea]|nr:hypothetical protein Afe04nite_33720 [Asanoa ferruginea]
MPGLAVGGDDLAAFFPRHDFDLFRSDNCAMLPATHVIDIRVTRGAARATRARAATSGKS